MYVRVKDSEISDRDAFVFERHTHRCGIFSV